MAVCHNIYETLQRQGDLVGSSWNFVKRKVNNYIEDDVVKYWQERIQPLVIQGKFAELLILQDENITWKSIMYNLPRKVLSFAANACIDSLPSYSNLYRWGKRLSNKCPFCPNTTGTLHHILAHCPSLLERYTWRHNSVLRSIFNTVKGKGLGNFKVYADIQGHTVAGGTLPPHIVISTQRPDLVAVWEDEKHILLVELTVPFETNVDDAHKRKVERYEMLIQDIRESGYEVTFEAVEIGSRGHVDKANKNRLKDILKQCNCENVKSREFVQELGKLALIASFVIFYSRHDQMWNDVQYITV